MAEHSRTEAKIITVKGPGLTLSQGPMVWRLRKRAAVQIGRGWVVVGELVN